MINRENRQNPKQSRIGAGIAVIALLCMLSALLSGCGQKSAGTETAGTEAAGTEAAGTEAAGAESVEQQQAKVYSSPDGWKLEYFPQSFEVQEKDGTVRFTCTLEKSGANYFEISYVKNKMPREVLYERIADIDDSRVFRSEGTFGGLQGDLSYDYLISPAEGSDLREQYNGIEHNGGTLLIHGVSKAEKDPDKAELISDTMAETMSSIRFTSHEPQQEFSYVPGTYERVGKEEIEGKEVTYTDRIVLKPDHTGTLSFQDDIPLWWGSHELILNYGENRYEYTVEGDTLMVNMDGEWISFDRVR